MVLLAYLILSAAKTLIAQAAQFITAITVADDYVVTRFSVDYQSKNWRISRFANNLFDEQALTANEPTTAVMWRVTTEKWK
jgi:outer membrane receptor protein involved in Fe transport